MYAQEAQLLSFRCTGRCLSTLRSVIAGKANQHSYVLLGAPRCIAVKLTDSCVALGWLLCIRWLD